VPSDFLDNPKKYEEAPVGNGPFMMEGKWEHDTGINVVRYEDWPGEAEGNADAVEFRIYSSIDTAYNDLLAGNLDIMDDQIPAAQIQSAEAEFGDRMIYEPSPAIAYLGFPLYVEEFKDVNLRKAISMAINREEIANTVRPDFAPIAGFVPSVVPGALGGECGGNCTYNPEEAKRLYDEAGKPFDNKTLTLWFNSGADHEGWVEAVSNQLRKELGINDIKFKSLDFAEYLPLLSSFKVTGPFRLGWGPDYPNPHTYLESIYGTGASSNYSKYSNKEFDELMTQAKTAESPEASIEFLQQAEEILNEDLPSAPLFETSRIGAWSEDIENVRISFFDNIEIEHVRVVTSD